MGFLKKEERAKFKRVGWRSSTREKKEKSRFSRVIYYFLLVAFTGVVVYVLFFSRFLEINTIVLNGTEELEKEKVINSVKSSLEGKYFGLIPKNNLILASKNRVVEKILQNFKKISEAKAEKVFPGTLKVEVKERKSLVLWCSGGPCYIVDEKGYAFSNADFESSVIKENNLVRLVNLNAKPVTIGEKVLEEDYINFVLGIRDEFKKEIGQDIEDEYYTRFQAADEVQIKTREGWDVYLNGQLPLDKSLETLRIFLEEKISSNPEDWNKLEYVDLRIENKVYYKLKNEEKKEEIAPANKENKDARKN